MNPGRRRLLVRTVACTAGGALWHVRTAARAAARTAASVPVPATSTPAPSGAAVAGGATTARGADCAPLLAHALRPLAGGETVPLCERFAGDVLLIVNTASKCGFTPQFEALETLHGRYAERGLRVLGFPSDDFRQELDDEAEVASFCRLNYGVTFPMFQKVGVSGRTAHPLFRDLAAAADGYPDWNFNKYLVDRDGRVLGRYGSSVLPLGARLVGDIEAAL